MKKGFIKRTKSKIRTPDKQLIIIIFILIFLGLILLVSASSEVSRINAGNPYYYLFRQLLYGIGIGLILFFITQKVHYSFWRKQAVFILMFCIFLLALVFVPQIGISHGGSKRWINLGFASFQPSELVKLGFIIYLAAWLEKRNFFDWFFYNPPARCRNTRSNSLDWSFYVLVGRSKNDSCSFYCYFRNWFSSNTCSISSV